MMLARLLEVRPCLTQVLEELGWDTLQNSEWRVLEGLCEVLEPFARYTSLVSGENFTTISGVIPIVMELQYHLEEMKEKPGLRLIASTLHRELNQRFEKVLDPESPAFDSIYAKATFLDPRCRILLSSAQLKAAKCDILREMDGKIEKTEDNSTRDLTEPPYKRFKYLSNVVSEKLRQTCTRLQSPDVVPGQEDLNKYQHDEVPLSEESEPLDFWIKNELKFPNLAPLACDILVIPASSAPVERIFSTAGYVSSGRRNRLSDKNLEREVLIKEQEIYLIAFVYDSVMYNYT